MNHPSDNMYRIICLDDDNHWVLASRSKLFATMAAAQTYAKQVDAGRRPELMTVRQLRAAYFIGDKCNCGNCMCCDLRRDIRRHDINLYPQPDPNMYVVRNQK